MKKLKVAKNDLKNIKVEVNKHGGFTVWVEEDIKENGKIKTCRHWILDASTIKEDGAIRLNSPDIWKINAKFDKTENAIYITKNTNHKNIKK